MSVTTVSGQLVHYEAFGRGKPVIFVHGWLGSWRYWWPTMQALASHHRSFAVDLWGFGDSSKKVGDYTIGSHVAMLDGFVNKMGIARPFTLVGHSLGAAIALRYARTTSGYVDRIAAVAMPLSQDHVNGYLVGKEAERVIDQSRNKFANFPEVVMGLGKADLGALDQSTSQLPDLALGDDLRQVDCPTLLIFGARDALIKYPAEELDAGDQEPFDQHCILLEDCSHFPMLEQPAIFNRLIREFIDRESPAGLEPKNYWQRRTR
ncbi:MAG: alpha/beta hydrolase [Chloroflexota bacterium]|jgi:pimeloyl-ACP methyl ester carboxylesterase